METKVLDRDRACLWHPYATARAGDPLFSVVEASGSRLVLDDGTQHRDVVDAMASWWCAVHGYRRGPAGRDAARRRGRAGGVGGVRGTC